MANDAPANHHEQVGKRCSDRKRRMETYNLKTATDRQKERHTRETARKRDGEKKCVRVCMCICVLKRVKIPSVIAKGKLCPQAFQQVPALLKYCLQNSPIQQIYPFNLKYWLIYRKNLYMARTCL